MCVWISVPCFNKFKKRESVSSSHDMTTASHAHDVSHVTLPAGAHAENVVVWRRHREEKAAAAAGNEGAGVGGARSAGAEHPHDLPFQITENKELARACEQLRAGAGAYSPMTLSPRDINSPARQ